MKGLLPWLGGKSQLAGRIIDRIPPHKCYCEVFAGGASVLFRKEPSEVEIINDINSELTNLYRVVQCHLREFVEQFKWSVVSRDEYQRRVLENPRTLTDIHRAVRFYWLVKGGYAAKVVNPTFGVSPAQPPRINLLRIEEELSEKHIRLARVYIENLSFDELIPRYDRPETFFYMDPPYHGFEKVYGKGIFSREDFERLRDLLTAIKGKFLVSINDTALVRSLFKGFYITTEGVTYTAAGAHKSKRVKELLISNYPQRRPRKKRPTSKPKST